MDKILIRNMRPEDYDVFVRFYNDLARIHYEAMPDTFRPQLSVPPPDVYEQDLQKPDRTAFAAEVDGKIAGMCILIFKTIPDDPKYPLLPVKSAHIDDLYVSPEFRRHGIATALYHEAERRARAFGASKMTLMVWAFNEGALELYRRLGMEPSFFQMESKL